MFVHVAVVISALCAHAVQALADPLITPAPQLVARATDPLLVGYISASGGYSDVRSCDYTETISTSGSYVRCCPTSGACPFFTACSDNTLMASGTSVPCDTNPTLTCNTAIVEATASAASGLSYPACWQKTLGSSPFTFVQDIGTASVAPASAGSTSGSSSSGGSSSASSSSRQSGSSATTTSRSGASSSSASSSSTSNAAATAGPDAGLSRGGVIGVVALLAQALL